MLQYQLKLSSPLSRYGFSLSVSDIDTKSTYSFSPMYPVKDGTCTAVLTGILRSLTIQVSHPPLRNLSFCLADSMKNPLRNLFNIPMSSQITLNTETPHFPDHRCWDTYPPYFSNLVLVSCLGEHQHSIFHLEHCRVKHRTSYQDFSCFTSGLRLLW